jgi:hypothetical protein
MKKIFTLISMVSVATASFGQALLGEPQMIKSVHFDVPEIEAGIGAGGAPTDTLGLEDFLLATPAVFGLPTGYASGMSHSVDTFQTPIGEIVATTQQHGFAEGYLINDDYVITGAMFFAGVLDGPSGTNPDLTVKVQLIEDNKAISDPATVQQPDIPGPGQTLASATVALDDVAVDPLGLALLPTFVDFPSMPSTDSDFCVSIDISNIYDSTPMDTVAIVTTNDGEGDGEYTYHQINQQAAIGGASIWAPTSAVIATGPGSGVNINFAMFPIVYEGVGIEEASFMNGLKMQTYPNPAASGQVIRLDYGLEKAVKNAEVNIYSLDGQLVFSQSLGAKTSGLHSLNIPAGTLAAGTYVYAMQADNARMAKKLEVLN